MICSAPRSLPPTTTTNTRTPPRWLLPPRRQSLRYLPPLSGRLHQRNFGEVITYSGRPRFFWLSWRPIQGTA
jgi:hypothetical protein